ncbi:retroviral-like aspartic protease family protein [Flavobacterium sp. N1736]|uniref:retroviral-like aspartic protease family protein n=1 Tax=Flavobacterium sp. N1736 TaxID=2986823 RepID=UPI002223FFCF|nr:retroviral-like aspartic protease family protein [Flavobacterium sp. N1736]
MSRFNLPFLLISIVLCCSVNQVKAQVFEKTPELHGDIVVFPITLVNAFPFISGTVNGVEGKFMFDTGSAATIALNDNFIKLPNKKIKGNGVVASGQTFNTSINDTIREIKFTNGITYQNLENITSANYDFLQKYITPDCSGYIGHNFFNGYLFKLDYLSRKITFYKNSAERSNSKDFLANEKVLAVIDFEIRKLPNHPIIKVKIDGVSVLGAFDTGQYGLLQLDSASDKLLKSKGSVINLGTDGSGDTLLNVKNIVLDGKFKCVLKGLELSDLEGTQITRKALGITEPNLLDIGYRFFSQYKTVWDYTNKKIYILEY